MQNTVQIKRDLYNMRLLADKAIRSKKANRAKIAAMLVVKGKMHFFGYNQEKTDPFQVLYQKHEEAFNIHAEIHALKKALKKVDAKDLSRSTLYVCRVRNLDPKNRFTWQWGLAKPCQGCQKAINEFGIKKVVYSINCTSDEYVVERY